MCETATTDKKHRQSALFEVILYPDLLLRREFTTTREKLNSKHIDESECVQKEAKSNSFVEKVMGVF